MRNIAVKSSIKTAIKKVEQAIEQGEIKLAEERLSEAASILDSAAAKGIIHKNNSSRNKSRMTKKLNAIKNAA